METPVETPQQPAIVFPCPDSEHAYLFIGSSSGMGTGGSHRHHIHVCKRCGQFRVHGWKDGTYFDIRFSLSTEELVEAAGAFLRYLQS